MEIKISMRALFCTEITFKDEIDIPKEIIRSIGLHVRCKDEILTHVPIEGLIMHLNDDIDAGYFISLLSCSWLKKIKYLRIWQCNAEICVIYSDKINIKHNSFSYLKKNSFLAKYYRKISNIDNSNLIFTDPPHEIKEFFSHGLKPNRLILVTPEYLRRIGINNKSICYRNCIVTPIWILYFITSNLKRSTTEDGRPLFKRNKAWNTLTDLLKIIYSDINRGEELRYLSDEEIKYVDDIYLECLSLDILYFGRISKTHP